MNSFESSSNQDTSVSEAEGKRQAFIKLFEEILTSKGEVVPTVEYRLPYPKEDFFKFLVQEKNVLLHGSPDRNIDTLEPRQANDRAKVSGNKKAVYGVTDTVFPIFHAILDRKGPVGIVDSEITNNPETGEREYKFSMSKDILDAKPFTNGMIYILDKNQFSPEHNDSGELSGEWTSENSVKPIAKIEVGPEDFRYLDKIEGN